MRYIWYCTALLIILIACQPKGQIYETSGETIAIADTTYKNEKLEKIIAPYRADMALKMNQVIGYTSENVNHNRDSIESDLGNWVADVVFEVGFHFLRSIKKESQNIDCFALLNKGGLRAPINQGNITVGNIYELMPFDNEIVIVKLGPEQITELIEYLLVNNGQPLSNAILTVNNEVTKLIFGNKLYSFLEPVYVITSNYLANGGDHMTFFESNTEVIQTGVLVRDALLNYFDSNDTISPPQNTLRLQITRQ